jgi:hypothetical protein
MRLDEARRIASKHRIAKLPTTYPRCALAVGGIESITRKAVTMTLLMLPPVPWCWRISNLD